MARTTAHEPHFLSFSLIAVFVIAILAIFGMVALVGQGPDLSGTRLATGGQFVSAHGEPALEGANIIGEVSARPPRCIPGRGVTCEK